MTGDGVDPAKAFIEAVKKEARKTEVSSIRARGREIEDDPELEPEEKIERLNALHKELSGSDNSLVEMLVDNAIENVFGQVIRKAAQFPVETIGDIDEQKKLFAMLNRMIDNTWDWNAEKKVMMKGVIRRATFRAMMKDPRVSIKLKREIMDRWEEFM